MTALPEEPTRRHRPTYVLWVAGTPRAVCGDHYWQPLTLDRPLPKKRAS